MADQLKSTQVQADIVDLLRLSMDRGASDLILTNGLPPMLRLDGEWQPTDYEPLKPQHDAPPDVLDDG